MLKIITVNHMPKQQRIDHFNQWPLAQKFKAESLFEDRLAKFKLQEIFFPYQLPSTSNSDIHITVSYLLDAVDSLPTRPDHAFDWTWRAFEYLSVSAFPKLNITNRLRSGICPELSTYFNTNRIAAEEFVTLLKLIPFQTCEYFLKRIIENGSYIFSPGGNKNFSSYAKRLLFSNGNPPITSQDTQTILSHLHTRFDYKDTVQRRNGASLLRKIVSMTPIVINNKTIQLTRDEMVFLALSGLGYEFRNDRAHAKSIAPFRSSYACIKTYAHCWFMFLLTI